MNFNPEIFLYLIGTPAEAKSLQEWVITMNEVIINPIIRFLFVVAVAAFFWGLLGMIWNKGKDPAKYADGKRHMIFSVIGMAIMLGVVGIMQLLAETWGNENKYQFGDENQSRTVIRE